MITRRQMLLNASAMAVAPVAPLASNAGILDIVGLETETPLEALVAIRKWLHTFPPEVIEAARQSTRMYGTAFVRLPYDDQPAEIVPLDKVYISHDW